MEAFPETHRSGLSTPVTVVESAFENRPRGCADLCHLRWAGAPQSVTGECSTRSMRYCCTEIQNQRTRAPCLAFPFPRSCSFCLNLRAHLSQDYGKLKRVAFGVIAHSLTPEEIRTLRMEFQNVDVEGRGEISPMDLHKALNKSDNYTKEEVEKLFEQIDLDQDGTIGAFLVLLCERLPCSGFVVLQR